ncbi:hypothetical protein [Paenibacillus sp. NFR01]|nr:hypothetical protein [Paenibacillus sp. NFR01]SET27186.1 hypothetical protein SAMN03159358_1195 [Paenibacillus sp. NFR01]
MGLAPFFCEYKWNKKVISKMYEGSDDKVIDSKVGDFEDKETTLR